MQEFYRGGGTSANTISGVPGKIDEMLGQYKKVAIGKLVSVLNQNIIKFLLGR